MAYIDFGMVGDLLNKEKVLFREMIFYVAENDEESIMKLLIDYNKSVGYNLPDEQTTLQIKHYLHDLISEFATANQKNFPITKFMYSLGNMSFKFHLPPPPFLMLIAKQIFTLEGLAQYLYPNLNVLQEFEPYIYSYRTRDSLKKFDVKSISKFFDDSVNLGMTLPESLQTIINKLKEDDLVSIKERTKGEKNHTMLLIIFMYLIFLGFLLSVVKINSTLILVIWGSIITIIILIYFIYFKNG